MKWAPLAVLALTLTPSWCFEQRCYTGEPAGIERTYLRPSLLWCYGDGPDCGVYPFKGRGPRHGH
jgi:hypothetical protein